MAVNLILLGYKQISVMTPPRPQQSATLQLQESKPRFLVCEPKKKLHYLVALVGCYALQRQVTRKECDQCSMIANILSMYVSFYSFVVAYKSHNLFLIMCKHMKRY